MARFLVICLSLSSFLAVITNISAHSITTSTNDGIVEHRSNDPIVFKESYTPFLLPPMAHHQRTERILLPESGVAGAAAHANQHAEPRLTPANFEQDFYKIQLAAARLVAIQDKAKRKGGLSADDNKIYADSLIELGQAAQNLAKLQQNGQIQDFSLLFQPIGGLMPQKQPQQPALIAASIVENSSTTGAVGEQKGDGESGAAGESGGGNGGETVNNNEHQLSEEDLIPVSPDDPYEDVNDSVAVSAPKKDASVAEAKPIGLSIAGEGGVASSKPNAVALSGRNGLAVSAPKATAIAGVSPEEAAAFSVSLPNRNNLVIKTRPSNQLFDNQRIHLPPPPSQFHHHHSQAAAHHPSSIFDEYDYVDLALRPQSPVSGVRLTQNKPHVAASYAGDAFVNKWKTLVAEDYAAANGPARAATIERQLNNEQPKFRFVQHLRNN